MIDNQEKLLVQAFLQTRSEKLFRELYRKQTPALYRLALQLTSGDILAGEDIIQEMWIRAIRGLAGFRWQSSLKTWLSGIVINCCREHNRKMELSNTTVEDLENLLGITQKPEIRIDIQQALVALPEGYREVLVLHDIEGYKHEEIGVLLGISEGTSKSQLFHARKAIKKLL